MRLSLVTSRWGEVVEIMEMQSDLPFEGPPFCICFEMWNCINRARSTWLDLGGGHLDRTIVIMNLVPHSTDTVQNECNHDGKI